MKKPTILKNQSIRVFAMTAGAVVFCGLTVASAQVVYYRPAYAAPPGSDVGFYLAGDIGPSFMQNFQSSRFGFPGSFSTRPGVRFGVEPGFNFLDAGAITLGGEFETGLIYNYLSSVGNAGSPTSLRGDYYQVPVLGNLVLQMHPDPFITPYIGIGGGGDYSSVQIHQPGFFGSETTSDAFNPAVQAMAGVRFRLNPFSDVGFGYKFLAAFPNEGSTVMTHAVEASFSVRF